MSSKRSIALAVTLMMATTLSGILVLRAPLAQTDPTVRPDVSSQEVTEGGTAPGVLEACAPGKPTIEASGLPMVADQPSQRIIDPERCPVGGRLITDGVVGNHIPPRGASVYIDIYGPGVSEEFSIVHRVDGTILLNLVGDEARDVSAVSPTSTASGSEPTYTTATTAECSQDAFNNAGFRFDSARYRWYFNRSTTPSEMIVDNAEDAIRRAGVNIASVRNNCGLPDGAVLSLEYLGNTNTYADIPPDSPLRCGNNDNKREVSFGNLPVDPRINDEPVAASCAWVSETGGEISDIKFNKAEYFWTAKGGADAQCSDGIGSNNPWDVQAIGTHERGHNFGLAHVSERYYGALTMSAWPEGPCQASERTLGRGDVRGINTKY